MNDYKPNSHKYKEGQATHEERPKISKVVRHPVKVKKPGELRKFADMFISEDAANVKSYIVSDVLIPAIKNTILDLIIDSAKMIFGGSGARRNSTASKISYRNFYDQKDDHRRYSSEPRARGGYRYNDITLETRSEAEEVLSQMNDILDTYKIVRVADLNDLLGVTGDHIDNRFGWTNLRNAGYERVRNGYLLKLPKALPLD